MKKLILQNAPPPSDQGIRSWRRRFSLWWKAYWRVDLDAANDESSRWKLAGPPEKQAGPRGSKPRHRDT